MAGSFRVPADALLGATRMRIRLHDAFAPNYTGPCGFLNYGEAEDSTVVIQAPSLSAGSVSEAKFSIASNPFQDPMRLSGAS